MKNFMIMICAVFAMSISAQMAAQSYLGVRGGAAFSTLNESPMDDTGLGLDMKYYPAIDAAVYGKFGFSELFALQPEIHFIQKGVKYTMSSTAGDVKLVERINFVEVPVLANFNFQLGNFVGDASGGVSLNVFAGPSVGYAATGKIIAENIQIGSEAQILKGNFDEEITWDDEFGTDGIKDNRFDLSGVAGIGLEIDFGNMILVVDGRYMMDFTDRVVYENEPSPEPDKYYNRSIVATAGIAFPLNF